MHLTWQGIYSTLAYWAGYDRRGWKPRTDGSDGFGPEVLLVVMNIDPDGYEAHRLRRAEAFGDTAAIFNAAAKKASEKREVAEQQHDAKMQTSQKPPQTPKRPAVKLKTA